MSPLAYMAYHKVLCWMWLHSTSQYTMDDTEEAWKDATHLTGIKLKKVRAEIMKKGFELFQKRGQKLASKGLKKEHEKQRAWRIKSSAGGKKSAERRWGKKLPSKDGQNGAYRKVQPKGNTTSTTPTVVDYVRLRNAAPPEGGGGAAGLRGASPGEEPTTITRPCPVTHASREHLAKCGVCHGSGKVTEDIAAPKKKAKPKKKTDQSERVDARGEFLGKHGVDMAPHDTTSGKGSPNQAGNSAHKPATPAPSPGSSKRKPRALPKDFELV